MSILWDAMPAEFFDVSANLYEAIRQTDAHGTGKIVYTGTPAPIMICASIMNQTERETHAIQESVVGWTVFMDYTAYVVAQGLFTKPIGQNWKIEVGTQKLRIKVDPIDVGFEHIIMQIPCEQITG